MTKRVLNRGALSLGGVVGIASTFGVVACASSDGASPSGERETERGANVASSSQKIVFGTDTRVPVRSASPAHRDWARSVPIMIQKDALFNAGVNQSGPCLPTTAECGTFTTGLQAADVGGSSADEPLCSDFGLYDAPSMFRLNLCTAFLVSPTMVVTAGHCVRESGTTLPAAMACADAAFLFGFEEDAAGNATTLYPGSDVYTCRRVLNGRDDEIRVAGYPADAPFEPSLIQDWAVIELDRPVTGRTPLPIRRAGRRLALNDSTSHPTVVGIGYPLGVAQRVDASGELFYPHQKAELNSQGDPVFVPGVVGVYESSFDGLHGNSGGPLIDAATGVVESIFVKNPHDITQATTPTETAFYTMEYDSARNCFTDRVCSETGFGPAHVCGPNPNGLNYLGGSWTQAITEASAFVPRSSHRRDVTGNGVEDVIDLYADAVAGEYYVISEVDGNLDAFSLPGTPTFDATTGVSTDAAQVALARLNAGNTPDVVALVGNALYIVLDGGSPTRLLRSTGAAENYSSFRVTDLNGDGIDDIEARTNPIDVYYGSATGPLPGERMQGFPTMYYDDGKGITVSGTAFSTIDNEEFLSYVQVPSTTSTLHVEIFDGDIPAGFRDGDWRTGDGGTCFQLRADSDADGEFETLVTERFSSGMPDAEWTTLFAGAPPASGRRGPSFEFAIRAFVATACDQPVNAALQVINTFKVRANGNVFLQGVSASFSAFDTVGPFAAPGAATLNTRDTTYDGRFEFLVPIPQANSGHAEFNDFDADKLSDPQYPGQANGANDEIFYEIISPVGADHTETSVSGNYDAPNGDFGENLVDFAVAQNVAQTLTWRWQNVLTENNIYIFAPPASPVTYRLFGEGAQIETIKTSSARTAQEWLANWTEIIQYLPVVIGQGTPEGIAIGSSVLVGDIIQAKGILEGFGTIWWPTLGSPEFNAMLKEEFTARLNLLRAAQNAEPLPTAGIYGRDLTVSEVMELSNSAILARCSGRACPPTDFDPINWKATYSSFFAMMQALHGPLWVAKYKLALTAYDAKVAVALTDAAFDNAMLDFMGDTYGTLLFFKLGWNWRFKVNPPNPVLRNDSGLPELSTLLRAVNIADATYLPTAAPPIILE